MARKISNSGRTIEVSPRLAALEEVLRGFPGLVAAYLYGSYGTPLQTPLSDVDIAVLFAKDEVPSSRRHLELIGLIVDALREEDVSVTLLNRAPLPFRYKVLAEGRLFLMLDEIAHADFLERTVTAYSDFAIDESRFFAEYDKALVEDYCNGAG